MVLHWRPVGSLAVKASHIWNANGERPSRFPSREKGNEVGREAISHTFFGLSPSLRALWKPKITVQAPSRDHTLTAFCRSSLPVLVEGCNCCVFGCSHLSRQREGRGEGLRLAVNYSPEAMGLSWQAGPGIHMAARASQETANGCPPYWVGKSWARWSGKNRCEPGGYGKEIKESRRLKMGLTV